MLFTDGTRTGYHDRVGARCRNTPVASREDLIGERPGVLQSGWPKF
jgi:hypothetical protein